MKKVAVVFLIGLAAVLTGCGGGAEGPASGLLSLNVTDAPVDGVTAVVVSFTGVEIHSAEHGAFRFELQGQSKMVDLLALQGGGAEAILEKQEVPAGHYEWVRLEVGDGSFVEVAGDPYPMAIASGEETGLKLVQGFDVPVGAEASFTIDFDLRKALHLDRRKGSSPPDDQGRTYRLRPALRMVDDARVGSIAGAFVYTDPATCPSPAVYVLGGRGVEPDDINLADETDVDPITTADVRFDDPFYVYHAAFLNPGEYTVALTCEARDDDPQDDDELRFEKAENATVVAGEETWVDF